VFSQYTRHSVVEKSADVIGHFLLPSLYEVYIDNSQASHKTQEMAKSNIDMPV
jgi:hypothetical protein